MPFLATLSNKVLTWPLLALSPCFVSKVNYIIEDLNQPWFSKHCDKTPHYKDNILCVKIKDNILCVKMRTYDVKH